jgi:hypothetical protein
MYICTYVHTYVCMRIYVCMPVLYVRVFYVCMHVSVNVYRYAYIYIYIYIYTCLWRSIEGGGRSMVQVPTVSEVESCAKVST